MVPGWVDNHDDCDDGNSAVLPGALEICDGLQNDCDAAGWTLDSEPVLSQTDASGSTNPMGFPTSLPTLVTTWSVCDDGLTLDLAALDTLFGRNTLTSPRPAAPTVQITGTGRPDRGSFIVDGVFLQGPGVFLPSGSALLEFEDSAVISTSAPAVAFGISGGTVQTSNTDFTGAGIFAVNGGSLILVGGEVNGSLTGNGGVVSTRGGLSLNGAVSLIDANDGNVISSFSNTTFTGNDSLVLQGTVPTTYRLDRVTLDGRQLQVNGAADVLFENGTLARDVPFALVDGGTLEVEDSTVDEDSVSIGLLALLQGPPSSSSLTVSGLSVSGTSYDVFEVFSASFTTMNTVAGELDFTCIDGVCTGPSAP